MKLKFIFAILISLACVFVSCASEDRDYLSYQKYPMTVEGILSLNGLESSCVVEMERENCGSVVLNSPDTLKDYRFVVNGDEVDIYYNDIELSLSFGNKISGAALLPCAFSADAGTLCDISTEKIEGAEHLRLVYSCNGTEVAVYKKRDVKYPTLIEVQSENSKMSFFIENFYYS